MRVKDSVFLVTGGGSGLGAATAQMFVEAGAKVVIADANRDTGEAVARELGSHARFAAVDVTNEAQVLAAVNAAVEHFGMLHGLVNCAGISPAELVAGKSGPHRLDSFQRVIDINLVGTFNVIRLVTAVMAKAEPNEHGERGVIVNTASVTAFDGQVGQSAYASSKAGVAGMTLPLARELSHFGIRVMAVAPGVFETPLLLSGPARLQEALAKQVPFPPRAGRPPEFAALVRHIMENAYLNGEVIRLDGASRLPFKF